MFSNIHRSIVAGRSLGRLSFGCLYLGCLLSSTGSLSAAQTELSNPAKWQSSVEVSHPLVGKIWSKKTNGFVDPATLLNDLKSKKFILLGETHDNPDHHQLQANVIEALVKLDRKPNLVIEMINVNQMRPLTLYRTQKTAKVTGIGAAVQWRQQGWPSWEIYLPIGEQTLAHDLRVFPGSAAPYMTRTLIKSNLKVLPEKAIEIFQLNKPLEPELKSALIEELKVTHCNHLPEKMIKPMSNIQRFRDAWMADVLIQAEDKDEPAVLIAGSGHTRTDRGVPWYLRKRGEKDNYLSIQFLAATKGQNTIAEMSDKDPSGKLTADYIWVTPDVARKDPCEQFIKNMKVKNKQN